MIAEKKKCVLLLYYSRNIETVQTAYETTEYGSMAALSLLF